MLGRPSRLPEDSASAGPFRSLEPGPRLFLPQQGAKPGLFLLQADVVEDVEEWLQQSGRVLDGAFTGGGLAIFDFGLREKALAVTEDSNGDLFVVGHQQPPGGDYEFLVMKLSAAGVPDTDFGTGGYLVEHRVDEARAVALDTQGRIVVGGKRVGSTRAIHLSRHLKN